MTEFARKGWCPGVLAPMKSGDGWLLRLRIAGGELSCRTLSDVAALALRFGSGLLELSSRANLQIRGVADIDAPGLQEGLRALGLLDRDAAAESVRNVTPSPLAGFDDAAALDTRPLVAALEDRLVRETALLALPGKFGFLVDGGGRLPLDGVTADIRFEAHATSTGPRLAMRLGESPAGTTAPNDMAETAHAAARAFLALRRGERRMAALVARIGVAAIMDEAGLTHDPSAPAPARRAAIEPSDVVGVHPLGVGAYVGVAAPFGSFPATSLRTFADAANAAGASVVKLTAWRALLAPGLTPRAADRLARQAAAAGLIVDGRDPRLALSACAGAPACASAGGDVRAAALRLAPAMRDRGGVLHVSGCAKGCARHARSDVTLIAASRGFDVVIDGFARDAPTLRALDLPAVERFLRGATA